MAENALQVELYFRGRGRYGIAMVDAEFSFPQRRTPTGTLLGYSNIPLHDVLYYLKDEASDRGISTIGLVFDSSTKHGIGFNGADKRVPGLVFEDYSGIEVTVEQRDLHGPSFMQPCH